MRRFRKGVEKKELWATAQDQTPFKLIQIWRPGGRHSLTQARLNHHLHCLDGQVLYKLRKTGDYASYE